MPAINPLQGAGCGFGPPQCHRTSHQLLGTRGDSRAAAQRVWWGIQGAPKPEHPKARVSSSLSLLTFLLPWCHHYLLGCRGTRASVAVGMGLAPTWEPLCLEQGAQRGRGHQTPLGPPAHLAAVETVMSDHAAMSPSPMALLGPVSLHSGC